jgi:hypothetical protein
MKFEIDVERLVDEGVKLNQYFLCQFIYQQDNKILNYYLEQFGTFINQSDFDFLVQNEYLGMHDTKKGYVFSNFFVTRKFINNFIDKEKKSKFDKEVVEDWIDIWYNLFPKGVKSGGYLIRSDKNGCLNKMKKFCKKYPDFTKEIILKATSDYIDYYRMRNWSYISLAHYLINKNDISLLAGQCEMILDKIESGKTVNLSLNQYKIDNTYEGLEDTDVFGNSMMDRL